MAFLLLLERLTPLERAVFLLHDVFGYGYDETARHRRPERGRLPPARAPGPAAHRGERPRFDVAASERDELADRFFAAVGDGDMDGLVEPAGRRRRGARRQRRRAAVLAQADHRAVSTSAGCWPRSASRSAQRAAHFGWPRSTASRARCASARTARLISVLSSTSPTARSRRSARSSAGPSCGTSVRSPTLTRCAHPGPEQVKASR